MTAPRRRSHRARYLLPLVVAALAAGCASDGLPVVTIACDPACPAGTRCTADGCVPLAALDLAGLAGPDLGADPCAACSGATPRCQGGLCVACLVDGDCPSGQVCRPLGGATACLPGCSDDARCGGAQRCCGGACTDVASDLDHCGACGTPCAPPHATATCGGGQCALAACAPPWADCNHDASDGCEANLAGDAANCRACGTPCSLPNARAACGPSGCYIAACDFGFDDCNSDEKDGCESPILDDPRNCGSCGSVCPRLPHAPPFCGFGQCDIHTCDPGFDDCDRNAQNGCEASVGTDKNNCGVCGNACGPNLICVNASCTCPNCNIPNSRSSCLNLMCTWVACLDGFGDCDGNKQNGCEVALDADSANCGACGNACPMNQSCAGGQCTDPVLSFDFEENGGNSVLDGSPLHNDGTLHGGFGRVPGYRGSGVHFDGTAWIEVPDAPALSPEAITLEVWVKFDRCTVNQQGIQDVLGKDLWDLNGGRQYLLNQQQAGFFRAHALIGGAFQYIDGNTPCVVGAWTHLAETYDGTTLILYVNGKVDAQKVYGGKLQATNTTLTLGQQASGSYRVNGTVDSVRIYPYARSAKDIAADAM